MIAAQITWEVDRETGQYGIRRLTHEPGHEPIEQYDSFPTELESMDALIDLFHTVAQMMLLFKQMGKLGGVQAH